MNQQINLYQPVFRRDKIVFSATTIFWLSLGILALLLLWSFLVDQRINRLEAEYQRQAEAERRAINQLASLRETMPPTEPDRALQNRVERLQEQRNSLRQSLTALERIVPAARAQLPERVDTLAAQVPRGLWLTRIQLADDGQHVHLEGRALAPGLVPRYIDALAEQPLMNGLAFRRIQVHASEDELPGVKFIVSTQTEGAP